MSRTFPYAPNGANGITVAAEPTTSPIQSSAMPTALPNQTANTFGITPDVNSTLIKCHATLMIFAWMVFAPLAILSARHKHFFGDPIWFYIHRLLNTLTFLCATAGVYLIFLAEQFQFIGRLVNNSRPIRANCCADLLVTNSNGGAQVSTGSDFSFPLPNCSHLFGIVGVAGVIGIAVFHMSLFTNTASATTYYIVYLGVIVCAIVVMEPLKWYAHFSRPRTTAVISLTVNGDAPVMRNRKAEEQSDCKKCGEITIKIIMSIAMIACTVVAIAAAILLVTLLPWNRQSSS